MSKILLDNFKQFTKSFKRYLTIILLCIFTFSLVFAGVSTTTYLNNYNKNLISTSEDYSYYFSYSPRVSNSNQKRSVNLLTPFSNLDLKFKTSEGIEYKIKTPQISNQSDVGDFWIETQKLDIDNGTIRTKDFIRLTTNHNTNEEVEYFQALKLTKIWNNLESYFQNYTKYWYSKGFSSKQIIDLINDKCLVKEGNRLFELTSQTNIEDYANILPNVIGESDGESTEYNIDDLYEKGLGGIVVQFGVIDVTNNSTAHSSKQWSLIFGESYEVFNILNNNNEIIKKKSFTILDVNIENLYMKTLFKSGTKTNLELITNYYNVLAKQNSVNIGYQNEMLYYDSQKNIKIKFVDQTKNNVNGVEIVYYKKLDGFQENSPFYITINQAYAKVHNIKLGDIFEFTSNKTTKKWIIGAFGSDKSDVYPLMYDTDIIANPKNELTIYMDNSIFKDKNFLPDNLIKDGSKMMINDYDNNENLKSFLNSINQKTIIGKNISNNIELKDNNQELKNRALPTVTYIFSIVIWTSISILMIITILILFTSIKEIIKRNYKTIGILKAMGVPKFKICLGNSIFIYLITISGVIISYPIGILIQNLFINKVATLFNISYFINWYPLFFLIILIIASVCLFVVVYLMTYKTISKNTIELIYEIDDAKPFKVKTKINKNKSFNRMMSGSFIKTSKNKLFEISFLILLTSALTSLFITTPIAIINVKDNYYSGEKYNNASEFKNAPINSPFSQLKTYDYFGFNDEQNELTYPFSKDMILPQYFKDVDHKEITSIEDINVNKIIGNSNVKYKSELTNLLGFNFISLKNKSLNLGLLDYATSLFVDDQNQDQTELSTFLSTAIINIISRALNITIPEVMDWQDAFKYMIESNMPAAFLNNWNNESFRNQFSIDFGTVSYNEHNDDLAVQLTSKVDNQNFSINFLNKNQKSFNIEEINSNKIYISQKMASDNQLSINDQVNFSVQLQVEKYLTKNNTNVKIDSEWWKYQNDDGSLITLSKTDLNHFTYGNSADGIGRMDPYFMNELGELKPYYKMANIVLLLPHNNGSASDVNDLLIDSGETQFDITNINGKNYVQIRPYDWRFSSNNQFIEMWDIVSKGNTPVTWLENAYKLGVLAIENESHNFKTKVGGIIDIYNKPIAVMDIEQLYDKVPLLKQNGWFNKKYSIDKSESEYLNRVGLVAKNNIYSFSEYSKGIASETKKYDFIGREKETIEQIIYITISFSIIFIIIIGAAIVTMLCKLISSLLETLGSTITQLNIMGYSYKAINNILYSVSMPFIIVSSLFGSIIIPSTLMIIKSVLWQNGALIPLDFIWQSIIIIIIVITLLTISIGSYVLKKHINENINKYLAK